MLKAFIWLSITERRYLKKILRHGSMGLWYVTYMQL